MSKFSVKKPLTVFVAVIAVLVLGVVSYLRMTPDLLPNMDFPYVIVITTYPGASPEKVENEITKPMEQSMATLEHIKEVSSTSSENVSTVILEFEEAVNMDTIGVDIQQKINSLSAGWDDMVGVPYVMKINPSMLPVQVAGVSMDGMSTMELTQFLEDTLLNKLEGIPGVARISTTGMIEQEIHVVLDQTKLDAINLKIEEAINQEIRNAILELRDQRVQLVDAKGQITAAQNAMEEARQALLDGLDNAEEEVTASVRDIVDNLNWEIADLEEQEDTLNELRDRIEEVESAIDEASEEELPRLQARLHSLNMELNGLETRLRLQGVDPDNIDASLTILEALRDKAQDLLDFMGDTIDQVKDMGEQGLGMMAGQIGQGATTIDSALQQIDAGFETLETSREKAIREANLYSIVTMDMVTQILAAQNFAMPAGYVTQDGVSYMVSVGDEMNDVEALSDLLLLDLKMEGVDPIYLKDVAVITLTDNRNETYAKLNGQDGVMLSFEKQSTYATAETTNNITARFRELEEEYPGLHFVSLMDQGDYIYIIVESILGSLMLGAVFAVIVLFLSCGTCGPPSLPCAPFLSA